MFITLVHLLVWIQSFEGLFRVVEDLILARAPGGRRWWLQSENSCLKLGPIDGWLQPPVGTSVQASKAWEIPVRLFVQVMAALTFGPEKLGCSPHLHHEALGMSPRIDDELVGTRLCIPWSGALQSDKLPE